MSTTRLLDLFESSLRKKRIDALTFAPQFHPVDLISDVVEVAVDYVRNIYPEHHLVIDDTGWREATIEVDQKLMVTALINILDNACKYSKASEVRLGLESPSGRGINLTTKEGLFLSLLAENVGRNISRALFFSTLTTQENLHYDDKALDILVSRLRKKAKHQIGEALPVRTIRSVGYCFFASLQVIE